jgi:uncharacterized protein DUF4440
MIRTSVALGVLLVAAFAPGADDPLLDELVALERSALDRWIKVDPGGYLDLYAPEVTYFDPFVERRIDGRDAMAERLAPMKGMANPVKDARYEIIAPRVQRRGDVAVLTFNSVSYGKVADRPEAVLARWNSTEVYARIDLGWFTRWLAVED